MARLKFTEKKLLEEFLEMGSGYVLDFSDRTMSEFFEDFDIIIYQETYRSGHSGSKANCLRSFIKIESEHLVGKVLQELIEYAESYRPGHKNLNACLAISKRLLDHDQATVRAKKTTQSEKSVQTNKEISTNNLNFEVPKEIFFSYAHEDETLMNSIRQQLVVRERLGEIIKWYDRKIPAGNEWRNEIDERINRANVILLFMSPSFLESRYCYEVEGRIAIRRHNEKSARVIPIILRACDWTITPFGKLQALPKDAKPITQWADIDEVTLHVAKGIMDSITSL